MVAVTDKTQHLLTMQTAGIAPNTTAIRSRLEPRSLRHRIRSAKWHHIQLISNGFAMRFS